MTLNRELSFARISGFFCPICKVKEKGHLAIDEAAAVLERRKPCKLRQRMYPSQIQLFKLWQCGDSSGQRFERVSAQIELPQLVEVSDRLG